METKNPKKNQRRSSRHLSPSKNRWPKRTSWKRTKLRRQKRQRSKKAKRKRTLTMRKKLRRSKRTIRTKMSRLKTEMKESKLNQMRHQEPAKLLSLHLRTKSCSRLRSKSRTTPWWTPLPDSCTKIRTHCPFFAATSSRSWTSCLTSKSRDFWSTCCLNRRARSLTVLSSICSTTHSPCFWSSLLRCKFCLTKEKRCAITLTSLMGLTLRRKLQTRLNWPPTRKRCSKCWLKSQQWCLTISSTNSQPKTVTTSRQLSTLIPFLLTLLRKKTSSLCWLRQKLWLVWCRSVGPRTLTSRICLTHWTCSPRLSTSSTSRRNTFSRVRKTRCSKILRPSSPTCSTTTLLCSGQNTCPPTRPSTQIRPLLACAKLALYAWELWSNWELFSQLQPKWALVCVKWTVSKTCPAANLSRRSCTWSARTPSVPSRTNFPSKFWTQSKRL